MPENKLSKEVAEEEFQRWAEAADLDVDVDDMNQETRDLFEKHHRVLIKALMKGTLVVDEKGIAIFTPVGEGDREPLKFKHPKGDMFMSSDKVKAGENVRRTYALLGAWTGTSASRFSSMEQRDLKVCEALFILFFG